MKQSTLYSFCSTLVVLFFTTGCITLMNDVKKEDCHGVNDEAIGRRDGAIGDARTRVSERAQACQAIKAPFNAQAYHQGEKEALQTYYCSPLHAITIGEQGGSYNGVCTPPPQLEERFLKFYRMGKRIHEVRNHIRAMDAQIETLRGEDWMHTTPQAYMKAHSQNPFVFQRLSELKDSRAEAMAELNHLEDRVAILKREEEEQPGEAAPSLHAGHAIPHSASHHAPHSDARPAPAHIVPAITSSASPYKNSRTGKQGYEVNPPAYNQMSVIYDSASTNPQQKIKIDHSSTEYEAQSPDRDPFLLPKKNVMKEGTTVWIERDWYPN